MAELFLYIVTCNYIDYDTFPELKVALSKLIE